MVARGLPIAVLLAAGCAHAPAETVPAPDWGIARASTVDTFEIGGQADHWGVRVTDDEILGIQPDFALARSNGEIRGRAAGVPVVVGFSGDEGAGVYRGAPFQVKVERTPAGLLVNGIFGGAISTFELSTDRINGRVGTCGWDVRWTGSYYSGSRGCGSRIEPISVSLPATMARWSDVEVAGALAMLMNVGAPRGVDALVDNSAEFRNPSNAALVPYYRLAASARPSGAPTGFGRPVSSSAGVPSRVSAQRRMGATPST
ncbi:MAG TPA: hypothetical protein VFN45_03860, partial [Myxococcaceae bacterium]|nr:hypothetical protein [Myxococcaceae bacterium]